MLMTLRFLHDNFLLSSFYQKTDQCFSSVNLKYNHHIQDVSISMPKSAKTKNSFFQIRTHFLLFISRDIGQNFFFFSRIVWFSFELLKFRTFFRSHGEGNKNLIINIMFSISSSISIWPFGKNEMPKHRYYFFITKNFEYI